MTEDQIKHMVSRFLGWRLPDNFRPDGGVSFNPTYNQGTPYEGKYEPSGTNLLCATQAEAMVRYLVEGLPREGAMEYIHYKTSGVYEVISDTALIEATKERAVVYKCQKTGQVWIRPYGDFHALVERPEGQGFTPRFRATGR